MKQLSTVEEVIEALGGVSSVARLTGVSYTAPFNWKAANVFPPRHYFVLRAALKKRGCSAPESLWKTYVPVNAA